MRVYTTESGRADAGASNRRLLEKTDYCRATVETVSTCHQYRLYELGAKKAVAEYLCLLGLVSSNMSSLAFVLYLPAQNFKILRPHQNLVVVKLLV